MTDRRGTPRIDSIVPTFGGYYVERLLRLVGSVHDSSSPAQHRAIRDELSWLDTTVHTTLDAMKYKGLLLVLLDVTAQGWEITYPQKRIMLRRPEYTQGRRVGGDVAEIKTQIRASFQSERVSQLNEQSTKRFIKRMEQPTGIKRPIADVLETGVNLSERLGRLAAEHSGADSSKFISPYLQLVTPDVKDRFTGQRLTDIWRYLRYTWAIPYQSTPGRNMFYLVRDAAHPSHAVMGIAALGNCVAQLSDRDRFIGWSVEAIEESLTDRGPIANKPVGQSNCDSEAAHDARLEEYAATLACQLESALDRELSEIDCSKLATSKECNNPTPRVVARLIQQSQDSEQVRRHQLRTASAAGIRVERESDYASIKAATRSPLYVRKRAKALADLLFARMTFRDACLASFPLATLRLLLRSDSGRKAIRVALHANKKSKVGSSMMDIIVCGAIPPYNDVLAGKLTAMLMASPQVVHEYKIAYSESPGEIVSRIAGRPIIRQPDLVFLTTTSLYYVGSSQYERIRVPSDNGQAITYKRIGQTDGFGSTVLSSATSAFLRQLSLQAAGYHRVNHVFGEGVSPKLRMTRDGLTLIGVPQDVVLRHDCPRLVYGVKLASNACEYLRGEQQSPSYVFPRSSPKAGTRKVIEHWVSRWLIPRILNPDILARVARVPCDVVQLSKELSDSDG